MDQNSVGQSQLDPFEVLPIDVFDLIFQHFRISGNIKYGHLSFDSNCVISDVNNFSLVSSVHYDVASNSSMCMKHFKLNAEELIRSQGENAAITRNYENISMDYCGEHSATLFLRLIEQGKRWKSLKISRLGWNEDEHLRLMRRIEPSVQSLTLSHCAAPERAEEVLFNFPKLKALDIEDCSISILSVFTSCKLKLKKLRIDFSREPDDLLISGNVSKILVNCSFLKELVLKNLKVSSIFNGIAINQMNFRLEKFEIVSNHRELSVDDNEALRVFLEAKAGWIRHLTIDLRVEGSVLAAVLKIRNLQKLTLRSISSQLPAKLDSNATIHHLLLLREIPPDVLRRLLEPIPNLRSLRLEMLCNDNIAIVHSLCPRLVTLTVSYIWAASMLLTGIFFPNLRTLKVTVDVQNLLLRIIRKKKKNLRSHFEKMILKEVPYLEDLSDSRE